MSELRAILPWCMTIAVALLGCGSRAEAETVSITTSASTEFSVTGAAINFGAGRISAERIKVKAESGVCKVEMVIYVDGDGDGKRSPDGTEDRITASSDATSVTGGQGVQQLTMTGGSASWNAAQGEPRMEISVEFCNGLINGVSMPLGAGN